VDSGSSALRLGLFHSASHTRPRCLTTYHTGAAQTATFAGRDYPIVGNTHAAADFNGDGKIDLAGAGQNVRVMLGLGDGSFRPYAEYAAGGYTQDVAAGDLNGDGRADLVVTNDDAQIGLTVVLGNGDGTFGAPASYPNDTGSSSPSVVIADFDQDGRPDVAAAHDIACFNAPASSRTPSRSGAATATARFSRPNRFASARDSQDSPSETSTATPDRTSCFR
jgi:hypothetical protein